MKRVIDCFTFYNELEILELRLNELYEVVDNFIIVEAEKTHKGENKRFIFEDNKWRFEKFMDKIIHLKVYYPSHIDDPWGREKYQRNSFMPILYSLGLKDEDIVFISDVDEIINPERASYIKEVYNINCINKMEMTVYFGNLYNKEITNKWYHPKVVNWGTLKSITPDECRLTFNCQWWENGGWHLTYFGGPERIANKLDNFAHQEYNNETFKDKKRIESSLKEGKDLFGEWRRFERIDPEKNPDLPKNWRLLDKENRVKKNLVLGTAIGLSKKDIEIFLNSFREFNEEAEIFIITDNIISSDLSLYMEENGAKNIHSSFNILKNDINLNVHRFFKYLDFVLENYKSYKNILITDVSDVVFQSDPFNIDEDDFIYFAEEQEGKNIGSEPFNSRWISITFGNDYLEKIGKNNIICAGTTIGSSYNILQYLINMTNNIMEKSKSNESILKESIDQGIHNYIARDLINIFKNPKIKKSGDHISTIGITCKYFPESIKIENDHILVNGSKPSIVHQYNRSEEITQFYGKKYKN